MPNESTLSCLNKAWRQHETEIRHFLVHRTGNQDDADDLLQEIFIKALRQGGNFCQIDNPRAWLFHVARNLLIDRLRLTKTQVPLPDDLCAEPEPELRPVDDLTQCIPRVLSELSRVDREAIVLCDLQGMTQQAYAQKLGLLLPAAKSRVQRARARLQAQLVTACQVSFDEAGEVCCFVPRSPLESPESE
ncbi:MAG: RNA polymerase sigma factor SigZ [Betaproteobacteria bacterium]|nr:RNA polymerase sigma factor SigZ [Betaproteobacteria bacterium]